MEATHGNYVGIDVAKDRLDVVLRPTGEYLGTTNDERGIKAVVRRLRKGEVELVVLEATGGLEQPAAAALAAAGVPVAIVPGISAAQGAAASLGFSLTERKKARRIQFVTGHGADGKLPQDIDWGAVADRKVTTVLYMPRKTLGEFVRKALAMGLNAGTPAVAVASATLPVEARVSGVVCDIDDLTAELPPRAPVTVIIGWVARDLAASPATLIEFRKAAAS